MFYSYFKTSFHTIYRKKKIIGLILLFLFKFYKKGYNYM
ncbi:hypothetical protein BN1321_150061 [Staphylococcus aureus]|uniref:Uncharacterized protein n=1 Tax=Staphylococcus aureus TaxID=1280 RepID=A0A0U1MF35_STAAU|nr:hypothetical protein BN1321_150061 [Staphylococcus aureus]